MTRCGDDLRLAVAAITGAGLLAGLGAGGFLSHGPFAERVGVLDLVAAHYIGTVTDTDAGCDRCAVGQSEGVVVGGKAGGGYLTADLGVHDILCGGDVAVDEHTALIAVCVLDHDGLDKIVCHFNTGDNALDSHERAEHAAVVYLLGGHNGGLDGSFIADLLDAADCQLALALIGARCAADADLVADLEVAGNGEAVDACGAVLDIDAVEECGVLIVAGGVGGHDALNGVLDILILFGLNIGDGRDGHGIEHAKQVLADAVVGVVLFCTVIDLSLNLEVGHERSARDNDETLAVKLLCRHHHQAAVVILECVLGSAGTAETVAIDIDRVGRSVTVNDGGNGGGKSACCVAACVYGVDRCAAVVAEALGVELVVRVVGIIDDTAGQRIIVIIIAEVQSPLINAVGCASNIIVGRIVADAQA